MLSESAHTPLNCKENNEKASYLSPGFLEPRQAACYRLLPSWELHLGSERPQAAASRAQHASKGTDATTLDVQLCPGHSTSSSLGPSVHLLGKFLQ